MALIFETLICMRESLLRIAAGVIATRFKGVAITCSAWSKMWSKVTWSKVKFCFTVTTTDTV